MTHRASARTLVLAALLVPLAACARGGMPSPATPPATRDSAGVTGVDRAKPVHVFDVLPNGGVIELQRTADDTAGIRAIRTQLRGIARSFSAGDFSGPADIRMRAMPGARVMADRRNYIRYDYFNLPRGASLRITTMDVAARKAIWDFIKYQRYEHIAGEGQRASP